MLACGVHVDVTEILEVLPISVLGAPSADFSWLGRLYLHDCFKSADMSLDFS